MKTIQLEFHGTGPNNTLALLGRRSSRLSRCLAIVVLVLAFAAFIAVAGRSWLTAAKLKETQTAIENVHATNMLDDRVRSAEPAAPVLSTAERRAWNQVVNQLNTPWPGIFDALEKSLPDNVALLSMEPDAQQASLRLQLEGKQLDTLLVYAGSMAAVAPFTEVLLVKHETNDQDGSKPIRLNIDLLLKPVVVSRTAELTP